MIQRNPSSRPTVIQRLWGYCLSRSSVLADQRFQLTVKSAHMIDSIWKEFLTHLCVSQLMNTHATLSSEVKSSKIYFLFTLFLLLWSINLILPTKYIGQTIWVKMHSSHVAYYYTSFEKICYKVSKTKNNIILPEIIYLFI